MRHGQEDISQGTGVRSFHHGARDAHIDDIVLEKSIFNNIFEKDIRRVFIYKKAERLAKAVHLITPAFTRTASLMNRLGAVAINLIDAATLPLGSARTVLSRELLALSSILSVAQTGGLLSSMNVGLILKEAHFLLQEIAQYEEPRLSLEEIPTLSSLAKDVFSHDSLLEGSSRATKQAPSEHSSRARKEQLKDILNITDSHKKDRRDAILSVIKTKGTAHIKDISTLVRSVSEKTIQRELSALIREGIVQKEGERRWSVYSLLQ